MGDLLLIFSLSLGLTLLLELPVARLFGLKKRELLPAVLVNLLTNPVAVYLNLLCRAVFSASWPLWQLPIELAVIGAEGYCYARFSAAKRPWLLAIAANLFSYACGLLFNTLL